MAEVPKEPRLVRPANRGDPELPAQLDDHLEHAGQQMDVLVAVQVGRREPGIENFPTLSRKLSAHFTRIDPAGEVPDRESVGVFQESALPTDERWNLLGGENRSFLDEGEVDAEIESGIGPRELYRVVEFAAYGHDRGRREDPAPMSFENTLVH
jgi:hypothetical protein